MTSPWVQRALTNDLPAKDLTGHLIVVTEHDSTSPWDHALDSWDADRSEIERDSTNLDLDRGWDLS